MTVKLVVLYTQPDDVEAFESHYLGTHLPMAMTVPGVLRAESGRIVAAMDGAPQAYHRVAELYFADQAAMEAGFGTPEGQATAADYQQIAPPGSRLLVQVLDD